jgi:hypothetical protein
MAHNQSINLTGIKCVLKEGSASASGFFTVSGISMHGNGTKTLHD